MSGFLRVPLITHMKRFLSPVLSPPRLDWGRGVPSKCFVNLIQIYPAVFPVFPFLDPFDSWEAPALRGYLHAARGDRCLGSLLSLPGLSSPLERLSAFERTYTEEGTRCSKLGCGGVQMRCPFSQSSPKRCFSLGLWPCAAI